MRRFLFVLLVSVFQILFFSNDLYASTLVKRENRVNHTTMYVEGYNLKKSDNMGSNSSSVYSYDRYFENAKPVFDSIPSVFMACFTQCQELEGLLAGRFVCHLQLQPDGTIAGVVFSTEEQYADFLTDSLIEAMTNAIKDRHFASFTFTDYVMVSVPITNQVINERYNTILSASPKTLSLSQIKDTEWRQIFEEDKGYSRTVRITSESAVWSVIESGTKNDVSNEEYYLTDEEPMLLPEKDQFYFDHAQVGKNTEGKYIMVYEKNTDTTRYYIVKDYDSSHLYLEVPASYLIHNGEKVYMSKSWVMKLEK